MIEMAPHFWTVAAYWHERRNPFRNRVEVGGFLVANPATPDRVAFATGPGKDAKHEYAELELCRYDVEPAVEAAGYQIIGDWHTHPVGLRPSDTDKETWLSNLKHSTLKKWHSIIPVRGEKQWEKMSAWSTSWKDGAYRAEQTEFTPGLTSASRGGHRRGRRRSRLDVARGQDGAREHPEDEGDARDGARLRRRPAEPRS